MMTVVGLFRAGINQPPAARQEDFVRRSCLTEYNHV